jgi:hypothetical protein
MKCYNTECEYFNDEYNHRCDAIVFESVVEKCKDYKSEPEPEKKETYFGGWRICKHCKGKGAILNKALNGTDFTCSICDGTGKIYHEKKKRLITVKELWDRGACWVKCGDDIYTITELYDTEICLTDYRHNMAECAEEEYKWATDSDRNTWHSFYIDEE